MTTSEVRRLPVDGLSGHNAGMARVLRRRHRRDRRLQGLRARPAARPRGPRGRPARHARRRPVRPPRDLRGARPPLAGAGPYPHLERADLLVIAPLTANTLARLAHGLADDLAHRGRARPRRPDPGRARDEHAHVGAPATQANAELLRARGIELIGPEEGELAEGETGRRPDGRAGRDRRALRRSCSRATRLAAGQARRRQRRRHARAARRRALPRQPLVGPHGRRARRRGAEARRRRDAARREPRRAGARRSRRGADPDRRRPRARGARARRGRRPRPDGRRRRRLPPGRPARRQARRRTASRGTVTLEPTTDVLAALGERRTNGQVLVGFAAEHGEAGLARAREKLAASAPTSSSTTTCPATTSASTRDDNEVRSSTPTASAHVAKAPKERDRRALSSTRSRRLLESTWTQQVPGPAGAEAPAETIERVVDNLARVVHAPDETLRLCVLCLVAEGHLIIEDFPGVGKTMLAKALARSLDCRFSRLQFTPDLLPSDVTGVNVFNQRSNEFEFRPGPVFANVLLVDEINRASPKTQAALLECMQEDQVTVDGVTYPLARPFMVLATQNPIEYEGTYPLPEAQLDRFTMRISIGYPPLADEARMLTEQTSAPPLDSLARSSTRDEVLAAIEEARDVFVEESLNRYVVALLRHTRADERLYLGASPRAGDRAAARREGARAGRRPRLRRARRRQGGRRARARAPADPRARGARGRAHRLRPRARGDRAHPGSRCDRPRPVRARARRAHLRLRLGVRLEAALPGRRRARARRRRRVGLGRAREPADAAAPAAARAATTSRATTSTCGSSSSARAASRPARSSLAERIAQARRAAHADRLGPAPRTGSTGLPRGRYVFERATAVIEDPLGLQRPRSTCRRPAPCSSTRGSSSSTGSSRRAARARSTAAGCCSAGPSGFDLHGVREYDEGESLRRVHWPSTARARRADGEGARGRAARRGRRPARRDARAVAGDARRTRASTCRCAPRARSCARTRAAAGARCSSLNSRGRETQRVHSYDGDWRRALELLAAVEPAAARRRSRCSRTRARRRRASLELAVVTASLDAALVDRLLQRALPGTASRSSTSTPRASRPARRARGSRAAAAPGGRRAGRGPAARATTSRPRSSRARRRGGACLGRVRTALLLPLPARADRLRLGPASSDPPRPPGTLVWVAVLGLAPALLPRLWMRLAGALVALCSSPPHGAPRLRLRRAAPRQRARLLRAARLPLRAGLGDFYDVALPFEPRTARAHARRGPARDLRRLPDASASRRRAAARRLAALALLVWAAGR